MKYVVFTLMAIFSLFSCSNDDVILTLGRWDSVDQFVQRFESMSIPNDDHSWVMPDDPKHVYVNENDQVIRSATDQDLVSYIVLKKMVNGKVYGIISSLHSSDWYAFPLQYSFDSQTKEFKVEDNEFFYFDKTTGNIISLEKSQDTYKRRGIIYNGTINTYTSYTIDPESKIIWFNSKEDAIDKFWHGE